MRAKRMKNMERTEGAEPSFNEIIDVSDDMLVAFAFLDHIGDDEVLLVRGQLGNGRDHAEIGIAAFQIKAAQKLLVIIGLFRIIVFGA